MNFFSKTATFLLESLLLLKISHAEPRRYAAYLIFHVFSLKRDTWFFPFVVDILKLKDLLANIFTV